jgi:hypothetical protein
VRWWGVPAVKIGLGRASALPRVYTR